MITIFRPYTIDFVPNIEKYLEEQALKGYELVDVGFWTFTFEESKPKKREYFIYEAPFADKTDKFLSSYLFAKRKYQKKKTRLNKELSSCFEVDPDKKDDSWTFYRKSRTRYYLKYRIISAIVLLLLLTVFVVLSFHNPWMIVFSAFTAIPFVYHLFSIVWLKLQLKNLLRNESAPQS